LLIKQLLGASIHELSITSETGAQFI